MVLYTLSIVALGFSYFFSKNGNLPLGIEVTAFAVILALRGATLDICEAIRGEKDGEDEGDAQ